MQCSHVAQGKLSKLLKTLRLEWCLCLGIVGVEVSTQPRGVLAPHIGGDHRARSVCEIKTIRGVYSSPDGEIRE